MNDKMKPGRELDALVAEKVMGLPVIEGWLHGEWYPPAYSTSIEAAWEVVEQLLNNGFYFAVSNGPVQLPGMRHPIGADKELWAAVGKPHEKIDCIIGDTAPHGICLAALKAMGVDDR